MKLHRLFNKRVDVKIAGLAPGVPPPPPVSVSAFITEQSLVSFPIATGVVKLIWFVTGMVVENAEKTNWVGLIIALAVGILIYAISTSDTTLTLTPRQKLVGIAIALINALVLFAAAAGIDTVTKNTGAANPPAATSTTTTAPATTGT